MRILQAHNATVDRGGGEILFEALVRLLEDRGHDVMTLTRSNDGLGASLIRKMRAGFSSIYSVSAHKAITDLMRDGRPDLVHVHGINPLLSASILAAVRRVGLPLVLHVHAYMLTCPIGLHVRRGRVCDLCLGGHEYWCAIHSCREGVLESLAYALRSVVTRKLRLVRDNVTLYVAPTQFLKEWLAGAGLPAERIVVMPNMAAVPGRPTDSADGAYVAYAGRISREKGVDTLVSAATETKLPVRLAGRRSAMRDCAADVPANVEFVGWLDGPRLDSFYRGARLLVLPSTWFEVSPLVIAEAMSFGLPVVASRIGGIPEMVEDGVTGLLFEPGNVTDLSEKLTRLWHDPALCREMGRAGREKAVREYSTGVYYQRLMTLYQTAMAMGGHTQ